MLVCPRRAMGFLRQSQKENTKKFKIARNIYTERANCDAVLMSIKVTF